jgi:uncharacterized peroxidase-related enzyme
MRDSPISWFPVRNVDHWPIDLARLAARLEARDGFVPNVLRAYAWRADRARAWFAHYRQLFETSHRLSVADREMIAVVVSRANDCGYCLASHGAALRVALGDPVLADRISADYRRADLDDRRLAISDYAFKLTTDPAACDHADISRLEVLGLSEEEVWDVIEITAMFNFTNRLALGAGIVPNDEYETLGRGSPTARPPSV